MRLFLLVAINSRSLLDTNIFQKANTASKIQKRKLTSFNPAADLGRGSRRPWSQCLLVFEKKSLISRVSSYRPIQSVIILVINKSDSVSRSSDFVSHSYDYRSN